MGRGDPCNKGGRKTRRAATAAFANGAIALAKVLIGSMNHEQPSFHFFFIRRSARVLPCVWNIFDESIFDVHELLPFATPFHANCVQKNGIRESNPIRFPIAGGTSMMSLAMRTAIQRTIGLKSLLEKYGGEYDFRGNRSSASSCPLSSLSMRKKNSERTD